MLGTATGATMKWHIWPSSGSQEEQTKADQPMHSLIPKRKHGTRAWSAAYSDNGHICLETDYWSQQSSAQVADMEMLMTWKFNSTLYDIQAVLAYVCCIMMCHDKLFELWCHFAGFTLVIGVKAEQLDITVGAPTEFMNKTRGLMGVFNNDPTDDMMPNSGGNALNANGSSERTIFSDFGQTCLYIANEVTLTIKF